MPAHLPRPVVSTHTVLYIEDNLANLRLIQKVLAGRVGIEMLSALSGRAGLALATRRRPDLILLDLHLPDVQGEDVFEALAADESTASIPVVIMSADATRSRIDRLLSRGARAYVTKPVDVDAFLQVIDDVVPTGALRVPAAVIGAAHRTAAGPRSRW